MDNIKHNMRLPGMKLNKIAGIACALMLSVSIMCKNKQPKLETYIVEKPKDENQPVTIYSHGYMCNKYTAKVFHRTVESGNWWNSSAYITGPLVSFNYSDSSNPLVTNLGQGDDIERLHQACKDYKHVILVGTSRGAATIVNYLATHKPTNIIGVVLESPFDHIDTVAEYVLSNFRIKNIKNTQSTIQSFWFRNVDSNGIQPIKVAHDIPKEIPILFICTKGDSIIHHTSTANLYNALHKAGHKKAHLLTCDHGAHGMIMWSKDGKLFRNVVHAFFKHYNLPYNKTWAQQGLDKFTQCQP